VPNYWDDKKSRGRKKGGTYDKGSPEKKDKTSTAAFKGSMVLGSRSIVRTKPRFLKSGALHVKGRKDSSSQASRNKKRHVFGLSVGEGETYIG